MPSQLVTSMLITIANEMEINGRTRYQEMQDGIWINKVWEWVDYFIFTISNLYAIYAVMRIARVQVQLSPKVFETQYVLKQIQKTKVVMVVILSWTIFDVVLKGVYTYIGDIVYIFKTETFSTRLFEAYLLSQIIVGIIQTGIHTYLTFFIWQTFTEILNFVRDPRRGATILNKWQICGFHSFMVIVVILNFQFHLFSAIRYIDIFSHKNFDCSSNLYVYMMVAATMTEFLDFA